MTFVVMHNERFSKAEKGFDSRATSGTLFNGQKRRKGEAKAKKVSREEIRASRFPFLHLPLAVARAGGKQMRNARKLAEPAVRGC